ncbi:MAG: GHKL domain-containing protein [Proteocatella sp.]
MAYSLLLVSLFAGLIYFYIVMIFVTPLKYTLRKSILIALISACFNLALSLVLIMRFDVDVTDKLLLFTIPFTAFWFQKAVSSVHGFKLLFLYFTVYWLNMFILFCKSLFIFVSGNDSMYFFVQFCVFILICLYVVHFFRKPFFDILISIHRGWPTLVIIPLSFSVILLIFNVSPFNPGYNMDYVYINILIFALAFTVYSVIHMYFVNAFEFFDAKQCNEALVMQNDFQYKSFSSINQKLLDFETFNSNMSTSLETISALISEGFTAQARDYIFSIQDGIKDFSLEPFCTNYMVNTMLSSYIQKARDENIAVSSKVNIPEDIHIDNLEICVVFSNAIENAINACRNIHCTQDRFLSIAANIINGRLFIKISNRCLDDVCFVDDVPVSSIPGHGFGTKSIISIAKKYDGFYSFEVINDIFNLILVL